MAIGNANLTAGHTYSPGDTLTSTNLNSLGGPTVALAFSGDTNTGLSNPSADVIGVEVGGTEVLRVTSTGIKSTAAWAVSGINDTMILGISGGTNGAGANLELYGGSHASASYANLDSNELKIRSQNAATTFMTLNSSGVKIGGTGNAIKAIWRTSVALDISPAAGEEATIGTTTVTGAAAGDIVILSQSANSDYILWQGYVSGANTVSYTYYCTLSSGSAAFTGNLLITVLDIT